MRNSSTWRIFEDYNRKPDEATLAGRKVRSCPSAEEYPVSNGVSIQRRNAFSRRPGLLSKRGRRKIEFGKGDFVTFPRGLSCTWDIKDRSRSTIISEIDQFFSPRRFRSAMPRARRCFSEFFALKALSRSFMRSSTSSKPVLMRTVHPPSTPNGLLLLRRKVWYGVDIHIVG